MTVSDPFPERPPWSKADVSFVRAVRELARPLDVLALLAVPGVLLAAFALPDAVTDALALSHAEPTPATALTAHYVHDSADHLLGNLSVYALVVPVTYLLCCLAGRRREFLVSFVAYLLVLPPVLSVLDLLLLDSGVVLGFSGVVMAFVGFLPLALVWYSRTVAGVDLQVDHAPGLFFLGLAGISLWVVPVRPVQLLLAGVASAVGLAYAHGARTALDGAVVSWPGPGAYFELAGAGLVAFAFGIAAGFPAGRVADGVVVNHYGHLLGYAIGFIGAYVAVRVRTAGR